MNNIIKISASLALTAGMIFTVNKFPNDPTNKILLDIDGTRVSYLTKQDTVEDFLRERGVTLKAEDQINLPVSTEIKGNETLLLKQAIPVSVTADGKETKINTLYKDVRSLLSALDITVGPDDRMNVTDVDSLTADLKITIQRVVVQENTQILPVAHASVEVASAQLLKGTEQIGTPGTDGERQVITEATYIDGKFASAEVTADFLAKAPVTETVITGTKAPVVAKAPIIKKTTVAKKTPVTTKKAAPAPKVKTVKAVEKKTATVKRTTATETNNDQNWKSFTLTFYTNLPSENGGYTITATGKALRSGMVASNYYSMGKNIYLTGYGTMTVEDRGGASFNSSSRLDVFVPRRSGESNSTYLSRVNNLGVRTVKGYVK